MTEPAEELRARLNAETGKLTWKELERHFARGVVIKVRPALDLIDVAACFVNDDRHAVEGWLESGQVARASEQDARDWSQRDPVFWAVVTAPWVLIQEISGSDA